MYDQYKTCRTCEISKPITDFGRNVNFHDGINIHCKICTNARNRESYQKFIDRRREDTRNWQKNNATWRRSYVNKKYKEMKKEIIQAYGGQCATCGFDDPRALCIDHVEGGGIQERKKTTPASFLRKIIKNNFPPEYQVLCANCNQIKAFEKAEIPVSSIYLEEYNA